MLSPEQLSTCLQELIAPHSRSATVIIEDRTGLLGQGLHAGLALEIGKRPWSVIPAGSLVEVRRQLWQNKPQHVALVAVPNASLAGLRDMTAVAPRVPAGTAHLLHALLRIQLPDDSRLDPLVEALLQDHSRLAAMKGKSITRPDLPQAILSMLLGEAMPVGPIGAILAAIIRTTAILPQAAYPFCREYAEGLPEQYQQLVVGLLTFGQSRSTVARALLQADISSRESLLTADALVSNFMQHVQQSNQKAALELFVRQIAEALQAEPVWGQGLVRSLSIGAVTHDSPILPQALESSIRRLLAELVAGQRTTVDDRTWRQHLFFDQYRPWLAVLDRLAILLQLGNEIDRLLQTSPGLSDLVQRYVDHVCVGDLAWMELGDLSKQAVPLAAEITQVRSSYQQARTQLNKVFAEMYTAEYARLFGSADLPLVLHTLSRIVRPRLAKGERLLLIIVDGLAYHLWQRFRPDLMARGWLIEDGYALALLPTMTVVSRHAIFAGPVAKKLYPDLTEPDDTTPTEDEAQALRAALPGRSSVVYKKRDLVNNLTAVVSAIKAHEPELVAVVINQVDDIVSSLANTPLPLQLDGYSDFVAILAAAKDSHRSVLVLADHGFTPDNGVKWSLPASAVIVEARLARTSEAAGAAMPAVTCTDLVYDLGGPHLALYDFGGRFRQQPRIGYHGGVSLEEVVVPAALLTVGTPAPSVVLRFVDPPNEALEDTAVVLTLELVAPLGLSEAQVEVQIPDAPAQVFPAAIESGLPFRRWQISWQPKLAPKDPVQPEQARLRAVCMSAGRELCPPAEVTVTVRPRPGKYESAVASLLP